jgi:hypothetical protein
MHRTSIVVVLGLSFVLSGCLESLPKSQELSRLLPSLKAPSLKDRNATIAQAWDEASQSCRAEHKPKGSFCEQLKEEGGFLACTATKFTDAARTLGYPASDQIWVWRNCVMSTASLLKDGVYMSRPELERRVASCQARLEPEPEYPVRQSGWLGTISDLVVTGEKESLKAVVPADFGIQQSRVALVSCEARFSSPSSPVAGNAMPVNVTTVQPQASNTSLPAPIVSSQQPVDSVQNAQSARPTPSKKFASSSTAQRPSNESREGAKSDTSDAQMRAGRLEPNVMKSCPIPGACGPTVPLGAVSR